MHLVLDELFFCLSDQRQVACKRRVMTVRDPKEVAVSLRFCFDPSTKRTDATHLNESIPTRYSLAIC